MISLDEARRFVLQDLEPLAPHDLELADALGCVAAEEVTAREPSPRFENSSMDGFALARDRYAGWSRRLRVISTIFAGDNPSAPLGEGEAARIMTGAPLPAGADSVCLREATVLDPDGTSVVIEREVTSVRRFAGWATTWPSARCWCHRAMNSVPPCSASSRARATRA